VTNSYAEVGTVRRELLHRTLIWNQRHLERLLHQFVEHYKTPPHRSLAQHPTIRKSSPIGPANRSEDTPPGPP
jgi:hypothetical protein